MLIRAAADALLSVALAPSCASCRQPLDTPTRSAVCDTCWATLRPFAPPLCVACGDPLLSWRSADGSGRCSHCRETLASVTRARSIGEYDDVLRALVHALKYDGRRSIASPLSRLMRLHGTEALEGADVAVPVPLHWIRQWRRGFNQALELTRELGLPVRHLLRRRRRTRTQADLPAHERHGNVHGAFDLARGRTPEGLTIVLVDDVRTTGATMEVCAGVLLAGGAREVRTLTAARVVTRPPAARPR